MNAYINFKKSAFLVIILAASSAFAVKGDIVISTQCTVRQNQIQKEWLAKNTYLSVNSKEILQSVLNNAEKQQGEKSKVVVFDLDETCFDNRHVTMGVVTDPDLGWLNSPESHLYPEFNEKLRAWKTSEEYGADASEVFHRLGMNRGDELFKVFDKFWRKRFFSNEFIQMYPVLYPGVYEFVKALHSKGVKVVYMTGRNTGTQREGTLAVLKKIGMFREAIDELITKDKTLGISSVQFKLNTLSTLTQKYKVISYFENDPRVIAEARHTEELSELPIAFVLTYFDGAPVKNFSNVSVLTSWVGEF